MEHVMEPKATPRRWSWRIRVLLGIVGICLASLAVLWGWPGIEFMPRVAGTLITVQALTLLVFAWILFLSGWRWPKRLGVIALFVLAIVAIVRDVRFSGDMVPHVTFRWQSSRQDALTDYLKTVVRIPIEEPIGDVQETDFPEYRGQARDGIVKGPRLARDWSAQPPQCSWRHPCGGGYAAFAVLGNLAVTIEQRGDDEAVVCYDARTGKEHWVHSYPCHFKETLGGNGPRATPTIHQGRVYAYGAVGRLSCLDLANGELLWHQETLADNDNITWAMSGSPLVHDGLVIVNPGAQRPAKKGQAVIAFDCATGKIRWQTGDTKAGYSSPMLATLDGVTQLLLFDGECVAGYNLADGKELWRQPWPTYQDINVAQPILIDDNRIFISSGYGVGCALFSVARRDDQWKVEQVWKNKNMRCKFTTAVRHGEHLYGLDDGILTCIAIKDGKRAWKDGRYGHGQLLLADDLLVILGEEGELALVAATPDSFRELGKIDALKGKTWNCPALANGYVYIRNDQEMARYDLAAERP